MELICLEVSILNLIFFLILYNLKKGKLHGVKTLILKCFILLLTLLFGYFVGLSCGIFYETIGMPARVSLSSTLQ